VVIDWQTNQLTPIKETKMLAQPFTKKTLIVALILTAALITLSFVAFPKTSQSYPDYALRHPEMRITFVEKAAESGASDWYQRHRDEINAVRPLDTTDYFQRHPEQRVVGTAVDLTDYYFRHLSR
jgi:hypothetical protein